MRKTIVAIALVGVCVLGAQSAWAGGGKKTGGGAAYGMAGCGLGSMVFKDNGKTQILAATTNGTSGNQTFGITSGTLNCTTDGVVQKERAAEAFAEVNFESISTEMAKGTGEHLATFGHLMGCSREGTPTFNHLMQQNYTNIFPSDTTTPQEMLQAVRTTMASNQAVAGFCQG